MTLPRKRATPRRKAHPIQPFGSEPPEPEPEPPRLADFRDDVLRRDGYLCQAMVADRHLPGLSTQRIAELTALVREVRCRRQLVVHHIEPGGMGRRRDDRMDNLLTLCDEHHIWVHGHPREAKLLGLLRGSGS